MWTSISLGYPKKASDIECMSNYSEKCVEKLFEKWESPRENIMIITVQQTLSHNQGIKEKQEKWFVIGEIDNWNFEQS